MSGVPALAGDVAVRSSWGAPVGPVGGGACGAIEGQFRHLHQGDRARVVSC